jgi:hypothetical protein
MSARNEKIPEYNAFIFNSAISEKSYFVIGGRIALLFDKSGIQ